MKQNARSMSGRLRFRNSYLWTKSKMSPQPLMSHSHFNHLCEAPSVTA